MDEKTRYYKFPVGNLIIRRTGNKIEKKGKSGIWENAMDQSWRFFSGDGDLIEISEKEAIEK